MCLAVGIYDILPDTGYFIFRQWWWILLRVLSSFFCMRRAFSMFPPYTPHAMARKNWLFAFSQRLQKQDINTCDHFVKLFQATLFSRIFAIHSFIHYITRSHHLSIHSTVNSCTVKVRAIYSVLIKRVLSPALLFFAVLSLAGNTQHRCRCFPVAKQTMLRM